jgi:hypothetical protein
MSSTLNAGRFPGSAVPLTTDFDFLQGSFDVRSRRRSDPLSPGSEWKQSAATSIARTHFNGAISIDEMQFADDGFYGMSVRLFDVASRQWAVYWINSRHGVLQPPVRGVWANGVCWFVGPDSHEGTPVLASYRWSDVGPKSAHWEQAFSIDGGRSWGTNWTMEFIRREDEPDHAQLESVTSDFDFLNGRWAGVQRRRRHPLKGDDVWYEFRSTSTSRTYFNGAVSVDEFDFGSEGFSGLALRVYSPHTRLWTIYWVDSREGRLQEPVTGAFEDGRGRFLGTDVLDGEPIDVRFTWTRDDAGAHWEQSFSSDAGTSWVPNWTMDLERMRD